VAQLVVNVVAEQVQEEHIAENVHYAAVQKGVAYELPQVEVAGSGVEYELIRPGPQHFQIACEPVVMLVISQGEDKYVNDYQGVVYVGRSPRRDTCPNR